MNKNCLEGMQCPECGSEGPFRIRVNVEILMYDDGSTDSPNGDQEWDDGSWCSCDECEHTGKVKAFRIINQKKGKKS